MNFTVQNRCSLVVGKYKCYPKYTKDELQQMKTRGDKAVCESKPGFKYTRGNDALAPGCGHCWCCQPVQPGKISYTELIKNSTKLFIIETSKKANSIQSFRK